MKSYGMKAAALGVACLLAMPAFAQAPAAKPADSLSSILMPHGKRIGVTPKQIRELPGGENGAGQLLARLTAGATDVTPPDFKGKVFKRADGAVITYIQPFAGGPPPTILIQAPKFPIRQLQFPPNPGKDGGSDG